MKRAILFTDIGGSTNLYRKVGDKSAHALISDLLSAMEHCINSLGGNVLRTVGDAVLAEFLTCETALTACRKIHALPATQTLKVCAGFHWGDVIFDSGDVYGDAVNLAARLCSFAQQGETVMSGVARLNMSEHEQQHLVLLDVASFKGIDQPIDVYRDFGTQQLDDQTGVFEYGIRSQENRRAVQCALVLSYEKTECTLIDHGDVVTIGRSGASHLCVSGPSVSKDHSKIECRRGRFVYTDLSTNGSFIAKADEPYIFVHRDSITLDSTGFIGLGVYPDDREITKLSSPMSIPRVNFALRTFSDSVSGDFAKKH